MENVMLNGFAFEELSDLEMCNVDGGTDVNEVVYDFFNLVGKGAGHVKNFAVEAYDCWKIGIDMIFG